MENAFVAFTLLGRRNTEIMYKALIYLYDDSLIVLLTVTGKSSSTLLAINIWIGCVGY